MENNENYLIKKILSGEKIMLQIIMVEENIQLEDKKLKK